MAFKITNPYQNVTGLIGNPENHYKTNLHTHSTYSDANNTMTEMVEAFYDNDFDILAFAEHGIVGKHWDEEPTRIPLFYFQLLWHGKRNHPTTEMYHAVLDGTYKTADGKRTKKRGLQSVTDTIETNMFTLMKNHVNGYFTNVYEGKYGKENDFEIPMRLIEESGGISHINHPTDWLGAYKDADCAKVPENVAYFADLLRRYRSCMGIEVLNMYDIPNRSDRILWDGLLRTLIPEGRNVWGFGNSDAHRVTEVDTAFMDFILPEYSVGNLRNAMENGHFFAIARYAKNELGEDFVGEGAYPVVTEITVDEEAQTITVSGENCKAIEWIADGEIIAGDYADADGRMTSTVNLSECSDKISCYVRCQLKGRGGICMTQAFVCDGGNMESLVLEKKAPKVLTPAEKRREKFNNTRLGVIVNKIKNK